MIPDNLKEDDEQDDTVAEDEVEHGDVGEEEVEQDDYVEEEDRSPECNPQFVPACTVESKFYSEICCKNAAPQNHDASFARAFGIEPRMDKTDEP